MTKRVFIAVILGTVLSYSQNMFGDSYDVVKIDQAIEDNVKD